MKTLPVVAAFLAGLGLGFLIFHQAAERPVASMPPEPQAEAPRETPASQGLPVPAVLTTEQAEGHPATRGAGVITGRVRTPQYLPVAGVSVRAWPVDGPDLAGRPVMVLSADDGTYRLEGLAGEAQHVEARAEGFRIVPVDPKVAEGAMVGSIIDFRADPIKPVPLQVIDPDGVTLEAARIEWTNLSDALRRPVGLQWTRQQPTIALPQGEHELRAVHPRDSDFASPRLRITVEGDDPLEPLILQVEQRLGIRGRVLVASGEEPDKVTVHCLRWEGGETPTQKRMIASARHHEARRSSGYAWAFNDLERGRYWLAATRFPDVMETEGFVELTVAPLQRDLELPPLDPGQVTVVRVQGPGGELVSDVQFDERCEANGSGSGRGTEAFPLADGSFALRPDRSRNPCDARDAKYFIGVMSRLYGKREVSYEPDSREPIVVRFDALATLTLRLTGGEDEAESGLLSLHLTGSARSSSAERIDNSVYQFIPVEAGRYEVVFMLQTHVSWGGGGGMEFQRHPVDLKPGRNLMSLPAPQICDLTVRVPDAGEGARLDLRQRKPGRPGWSGIQINGHPVAADGRAFFEAIPAGSYTLISAKDYADGEMELEVTRDAVVDFDPRPYTVLRVTIIEADSNLAKQGFVNGDTIVALDGEELSPGREALMARLRGLRGREGAITCRVLRSGVPLTLQVEARVLAGDAQGGWIEPATQ